MLRAAGRLDEALAAAEAARDAAPKWVSPRIELGLIHFTRNVWRGPRELRRSCRHADKSPYAFMFKGRVAMAMGRFRRCRRLVR
jgi:hypothetical protein